MSRPIFLCNASYTQLQALCVFHSHKPKLGAYIKLHYTGEQNTYLQNVDRFDRLLISKFKHGTLTLRIETAWYIGELVENRLCQNCEQTIVEDELHFSLKCDL